jgi:hypothetical protein
MIPFSELMNCNPLHGEGVSRYCSRCERAVLIASVLPGLVWAVKCVWRGICRHTVADGGGEACTLGAHQRLREAEVSTVGPLHSSPLMHHNIPSQTFWSESARQDEMNKICGTRGEIDGKVGKRGEEKEAGNYR